AVKARVVSAEAAQQNAKTVIHVDLWHTAGAGGDRIRGIVHDGRDKIVPVAAVIGQSERTDCAPVKATFLKAGKSTVDRVSAVVGDQGELRACENRNVGR